jgi:hypothetical protein
MLSADPRVQGAATNTLLSSLTPNTRYNYTVQAFTTIGNSRLSPVSFVTSDYPACPNCTNGDCIRGVCYCREGFVHQMAASSAISADGSTLTNCMIRAPWMKSMNNGQFLMYWAWGNYSSLGDAPVLTVSIQLRVNTPGWIAISHGCRDMDNATNFTWMDNCDVW